MALAGLSLATCHLSLTPSSAAPPPKPNILFIFLDDFGWKDTSYMGSDFYETPHLDRLAAGGMVFTNGYSSAANCAPARACLLSGQYSPRHEIYNVGTGPRGKAQYRRLKHIPGTDTLRPDIVTWASALQAAGYQTATIGKWHLSDDPKPYGFDVNIGGTHSGGPPKGYYPPHGKVPGLKNAPEGEYLTDRLSAEAVDFITANARKPWLLYLTHFAVHTPIQAKRELLAKYQAKPPGALHDDVRMATMIQAVDDGVGEIVAVLEDLGLRENTAIFFFSDNGGYGPATDMDPLKGYKGTYYEGGIRVPFFVNWPGTVAPARTEAPMIGVDIYPTFCEIGGAPMPAGQPADGLSLLPLLTGRKNAADALAQRPLYWHFPAYLQSYGPGVNSEQRDPLFRTRPCSIVRVGDFKLHQYFEDGGLELYNLADDIGESRDLSSSMPEKVAELKRLLENWRRDVNAPVPTEANPEFDQAAEAAAIAAMLEKKSGGHKSGKRIMKKQGSTLLIKGS
ncbi:MAG: sulfatase [Verrucomicrobiales bacterium]